MNKLSTYLKKEKRAKRKGGLYHKTQVTFAYNSNKIGGSKLTEEQARCVFETRTIGFKDQEAVPVDDIIETSNHFVAFDYLLNTVDRPLSPGIIKKFHRILKTGTSDATKENVAANMNELNNWYASIEAISFEDIIEYHYRFEKIHPFQDGNGRVGRLILFRECLRNNIIPFVIDDGQKQFYYRGLKGFEHVRVYLIDACLSAQDTYKGWIRCFYGDLSGREGVAE